MSKDEPKKLRN